MKKVALAIIPLLLVLALAVIGCGKTPGGTGGTSGPPANTVTMTSDNFTAHTLTVKANDPITFDDPSNGGNIHVLCVGTGNGGTNTCDKSGNAPSSLYGQGMTFNAGDTQKLTFTTAGSYHVICTLHPGMYIDITVQ